MIILKKNVLCVDLKNIANILLNYAQFLFALFFFPLFLKFFQLVFSFVPFLPSLLFVGMIMGIVLFCLRALIIINIDAKGIHYKVSFIQFLKQAIVIPFVIGFVLNLIDNKITIDDIRSIAFSSMNYITSYDFSNFSSFTLLNQYISLVAPIIMIGLFSYILISKLMYWFVTTFFLNIYNLLIT